MPVTPTALRAALLSSVLAAAGCIFAPSLGDGQIRCGSDSSCPPGQACAGDGLCHKNGGVSDLSVDSTCTPLHCYVGWCGPVDDGCGKTLNCGSCDPSMGVRDMGAPLDLAGCVPSRKCIAGVSCGTIDDGCGHPLSCGDCTEPRNCSTTKPNQCMCTPTTCAAVNATCGFYPSGCGAAVLDCFADPDMGACPPGTGRCGGGGPYTCGKKETCNPLTVCPAGACGVIPNGCNGVLHCGLCPTGKVCGGAGKPNVCG
jgi:hypothetical protein